MSFPRIIPLLQVSRGRLVKTLRFGSPVYVGDPINAVKVFNAKEVDELIILDIDATREGQGPDFGFVASIVDECFMPLCYGGGVRTVEDMIRLFALGVEKVALHDALFEDPDLLTRAAAYFGSQSLICSVDAVREDGRSLVYRAVPGAAMNMDPPTFVRELERRGAGEILLHSVDRDGTRTGYDLDLVAAVAGATTLPVVAAGGAGRRHHLGEVLRAGASGAAAGSLFVFHGPHKAVLLSYPPPEVVAAYGQESGAPPPSE